MATLIAALLLAATHLLTGELGWLQHRPRQRMLSFAGGISVAYVFIELLPEIAEAQDHIQQGLAGASGVLKHHAYVLALFGLVVAYGLDALFERHEDSGDEASVGVFWLHTLSFAVYSGLIGYLLRVEDRSVLGLVFYAVAMALHFTVTDAGLWRMHRRRFHRLGRWILALGVLLGVFVAEVTELSAAAEAATIAWLSGGIILNALKEELPTERNSQFAAFAIGAAAYTVLLLVSA